MSFATTILAYLGPETMLPMTSVIAGAVGVVMLFGRNAWRIAKRTAGRIAAMAGPAPKPRPKARKIGTRPIGPVGAHRHDGARGGSARS